MDHVRSKVADWVTIGTAIFTFGSTLYSASGPVFLGAQEPSVWDAEIAYSVALLISMVVCCFFIDSSLRLSAFISKNKLSPLPDGVVYVLTIFVSFSLFLTSQQLIQSKILAEPYISVNLIPSMIWLGILITLIVKWLNKLTT